MSDQDRDFTDLKFQDLEACLVGDEDDEAFQQFQDGINSETGEVQLTPKAVLRHAEALAKRWISLFFATKEMHCGGPISDRVLLSKRYIDLVLNTDLILAVEVAYAAMEVDRRRNKKAGPVAKMGGIANDIQWVITFLNHCGQMKLPPAFIGGTMLVYLEVCEGIPIPNGLI